MKITMYLLIVCTMAQLGAAASSSSSSSSKGKGKRHDHVALDIRALETTPPLQQPVGTKEYAKAFTQVIYGKSCGDKFCTDALRQRLKYLQEHDRPAFERLIAQLSQSNEVLTHRTRSRGAGPTRFDAGMLTELISPEMVQQLLKALKEQHQQQEEQLGQHVITIDEHEGTITEHEETIASQEGSLRTGKYKFYGAVAAAAISAATTIALALISAS